jgi:hypothetical protein
MPLFAVKVLATVKVEDAVIAPVTDNVDEAVTAPVTDNSEESVAFLPTFKYPDISTVSLLLLPPSLTVRVPDDPVP